MTKKHKVSGKTKQKKTKKAYIENESKKKVEKNARWDGRGID